MKRIGYFGLSTPAFYDYRTQVSRASSDTSDSPNPILEGAFGALLLYDELWFLCRSLCPENMRSLPYVKFLDEINQLPDVDPQWLPNPSEVFDPAAIKAFGESSAAYYEVKNQVRVNWDVAADNHTHGLKVGEFDLNGNSWNIRNVLFDILITERLPNRVELITNSFTARLFTSEASVRDRLVLSELLVLDSVPQFLNRLGPYHPCIEDVRESAYLTHFRDWIQNEDCFASPRDVGEIKAEVEAKLAESQREVFMKYLDPKSGYKSVAKTMLGVGVDKLLPGASTITDLIGQYKNENDKQKLRWQGFILDARTRVTR